MDPDDDIALATTTNGHETKQIKTRENGARLPYDRTLFLRHVEARVRRRTQESNPPPLPASLHAFSFFLSFFSLGQGN